MCITRKEVSALEVNAKIREIKPFTLSELDARFPDISPSVIYKILQAAWKVWRRTFSIKGIEKVIPRYERCLHLHDEYVE